MKTSEKIEMVINELKDIKRNAEEFEYWKEEFIKRLKENIKTRFKSMQTKEAQKDEISCKLLEDIYIKPTFEEIDKLAGEELAK